MYHRVGAQANVEMLLGLACDGSAGERQLRWYGILTEQYHYKLILLGGKLQTVQRHRQHEQSRQGGQQRAPFSVITTAVPIGLP